mmetsp:Transcript_718/g.1622  ORF Transcript_718/g.1622 Transcript_718/m.1622 type:complete len:254 (-) Transcript_718:1886-2647(-)
MAGGGRCLVDDVARSGLVVHGGLMMDGGGWSLNVMDNVLSRLGWSVMHDRGWRRGVVDHMCCGGRGRCVMDDDVIWGVLVCCRMDPVPLSGICCRPFRCLVTGRLGDLSRLCFLCARCSCLDGSTRRRNFFTSPRCRLLCCSDGRGRVSRLLPLAGRLTFRLLRVRLEGLRTFPGLGGTVSRCRSGFFLQNRAGVSFLGAFPQIFSFRFEMFRRRGVAGGGSFGSEEFTMCSRGRVRSVFRRRLCTRCLRRQS